MIVVGRIASGVGGSSSPIASRPFLSRSASPIPAASPTAEPRSPITNDSMTTDLNTCPRLAPSARRSPSSRVRCVTTMLNVLKITKAPTNNATNANTSSAVRRNPKPSRTCSVCSEAASVAVIAWKPDGSTSWTCAATVAADAPSRATM